MSRIVIALGGNALGNNPNEQQEMIEAACPALIGLISQGHEIIVSHGNGPQVGMINKAFDVASKSDSSVSPMELMECTAMSLSLIHILCLLSEGRNPSMSKEEIEKMLCEYLNCETVIWVTVGIDPEETNGHIDDVACFIRPGEAACIYTEDRENPFYEAAKKAYEQLCEAVDARGRKLKVHKLCLPKKPVLLSGSATIDQVEGTIPREDGDICIASYKMCIRDSCTTMEQYLPWRIRCTRRHCWRRTGSSWRSEALRS